MLYCAPPFSTAATLARRRRFGTPSTKSKLASSNGRAERLAKGGQPVAEKVRELYLAAFSREPRAEELKTALEFLSQPQIDANGKSIAASKMARENFQDLLWALINTKEFLFNH